MTLKTYIWGMRIITLFSLITLGIIIVYVNPQSSGFLGMFLFYSVIFFALSGIFNLFLIFIRKRFLGNETTATNIGLSFRQGILLAILCLALLILQSYRILIWWDALFVVAGIFLIELFFLSRS